VKRRLCIIKQNAFQEAFQKCKKWGITLKGTVCENDVSYLIKLFCSQFSLFLNTPRIVIALHVIAPNLIIEFLLIISQILQNYSSVVLLGHHNYLNIVMPLAGMDIHCYIK
jgi:hypothetical protein